MYIFLKCLTHQLETWRWSATTIGNQLAIFQESLKCHSPQVLQTAQKLHKNSIFFKRFAIRPNRKCSIDQIVFMTFQFQWSKIRFCYYFEPVFPYPQARFSQVDFLEILTLKALKLVIQHKFNNIKLPFFCKQYELW